MDKITRSLQHFLKNAKIKFNSMYNTHPGIRMQEQTSTVFHATRKFDKLKIAIIIDIYPEDKNIYISTYPLYVFNNDKINEIRNFENKWNTVGMFSNLSIEEEKGVTEADKYCFLMTSRILSEKDGLSDNLWRKYIDLTINETLDAWETIEKIVNPDLIEIIPLLYPKNSTEISLQTYHFN